MKKKEYRSTFIFYDYETFGIHTSKDRPSQFACIRTNKKFEIIEKPKIFFCCPSSDYIPNLKSILLTGITPKKAKKNGIIESEFSYKIYNIFNIPKTCIVGFNNIKFDDEFTRYMFYRNLLDPYSWSWKNKNSRWDIIKVMRALYILRPNNFFWPNNINGNPTFKLHSLAKSNNITIKNPHNAINDVLTTLKLTRLAYIREPKIFKYLYYIRKKKRIKNLINTRKITPFVYIPDILNNKIKNNIHIITPILLHKENNNILIALDLVDNFKKINSIKLEILNKKFFLKKYLKLNNKIYSIIFIYINKCPNLFPINVLRDKDFNRLKINKKNYLYNIEILKKNNDIFKKIIYFFNKKKYKNIKNNSNVDSQLYNNFFNKYDRFIMNKILKTDPKKISLIHTKFNDIRLYKLLFKYRARNFPNTLNLREKICWTNYKKKIFNTKNLNNFFNEIKLNKKIYSKDKNKINILEEVLYYIKELIKKL